MTTDFNEYEQLIKSFFQDIKNNPELDYIFSEQSGRTFDGYWKYLHADNELYKKAVQAMAKYLLNISYEDITNLFKQLDEKEITQPKSEALVNDYNEKKQRDKWIKFINGMKNYGRL